MEKAAHRLPKFNGRTQNVMFSRPEQADGDNRKPVIVIHKKAQRNRKEERNVVVAIFLTKSKFLYLMGLPLTTPTSDHDLAD